jgi:hypothetical protein
MKKTLGTVLLLFPLAAMACASSVDPFNRIQISVTWIFGIIGLVSLIIFLGSLITDLISKEKKKRVKKYIFWSIVAMVISFFVLIAMLAANQNCANF